MIRRSFIILRRSLRKIRFKIGIVISLVAIFLAILAPYIVPHPQEGLGYVPRDVEARRLLPPSIEHIFGTDSLGRDLFSRVIMGTRTALLQVFIVITISFLLGLLLGAIAAYLRGLVEVLLNYFTEIFMAMPTIVIALVLRLTLGHGIHVTISSLIMTWWAWYARIAYVYARGVVELDYVILARLAGLHSLKILYRHIVPNIIQPLIAQAITDLGSVLLEAAAINFLGLGVQPGYPEWGVILYESVFYGGGVEVFTQAPWLIVFPGVFLLLVTLGFSLIGDCLREEIDPRLRRRWRLWF